MPTSAEIPEEIRVLMRTPNNHIGDIEQLIIKLGVNEELRILIHRELSMNLLPPGKQ